MAKVVIIIIPCKIKYPLDFEKRISFMQIFESVLFAMVVKLSIKNTTNSK